MIKYVLGEYGDTMPIYVRIEGNNGYLTLELEEATKFDEMDNNLTRNSRFVWLPFFDVSDLVEE